MDGPGATDPSPEQGSNATDPSPEQGSSATNPSPVQGSNVTDPSPEQGSSATDHSPVATEPSPVQGSSASDPSSEQGSSATDPSPDTELPGPTAASTEKAKTNRKFSAKWQTVNPWLQIKDDKMYCNLCVSANKKNAFTRGCTNFKTSALKEHTETADHRASAQVPRLKKNIDKLNKKALSEKEKGIITCLKVTLWMVNENLAITKFSSLMQLLQDLKCPDIDILKVTNEINYTSDFSFGEFLQAINNVVEKETIETLEDSQYVTALGDETTDIAITKKFILYAQVCTPDMEGKTLFISNTKVPDGTGKTISTEIYKQMSNRGVDEHKVTGLGSDGAKVMTGVGEGVTGHMLRKNAHLVNVHCNPHRLNLCISQAAEKVPAMVQYCQTLDDIGDYFKKSSNRNEKMAEVHEALGTNYLKYKEYCPTRWLSLYNCLDVVHRTMDALLTYFGRNMDRVQKDPKANGLTKKVATRKFICITHFLRDIIPVVSTLSMFLQTENVDIAMVKVRINQTVADLEKLKENEGPFSATLAENLDSEKHEFMGHQIAWCRNEEIQSCKDKFLQQLIDNINSRFSQKDIVAAFAVLAMRPVSFMTKEELTEYGNEEIEMLINHYGVTKTHTWKEGKHQHEGVSCPPIIDSDKTREEWQQAKECVYAQKYTRISVSQLWHQIKLYHPNQFPNLEKLAQLAVVCPIHSAGCERGFSLQNQIITPLRNRLDPDTMDKLMRVKIQAKPHSEFDWVAALNEWTKMKPRAIFGYRPPPQ